MTKNEVLEIKAKIMEVAQSKGVDIDFGADDMIDLLEKIKDVPTFSPTTLNELAETVYDWFIDRVQLEDKANYTENAITIYTPSANCKSYIIRQRSDNQKYHIVWIPTGNGAIKQNSTAGQIVYPMRYSNNNTIVAYETFKTSDLNLGLQLWYPSSSVPYYVSTNAYNTVAEAITAIQSSSTAYSAFTSGNTYSSVATGPLYSNCDFYVPSNSNISSFDEFYKPTPISPNETIEVKQ